MKYITIILITFTISAFAQEQDSTIYYNYINTDGVQSVTYLNGYFNNSRPKYEGWAVHKDIPDYEYEESKMGIWIFYYRNGNIKYKYDYGKLKNDTTTRKLFDRKNNLEYESIYFVKEEQPPSTSKDITKKNGKTKDNKWERFTSYDKIGVSIKGQFGSDGNREGKWFYYKKGKLRKVKEYKGGKLLKVEKS